MNMEFPKEKSPAESTEETRKDAKTMDAQEQEKPSLDDENIQAAYRKAYFEQLRRRACPGCGETEMF